MCERDTLLFDFWMQQSGCAIVLSGVFENVFKIVDSN